MSKSILIAALALLSTSAYSIPSAVLWTPDLHLTPGELCSTPDEYRYPARINYCRRIVPNTLKDQVIVNYNQVHGMGIHLGNRRCYKIDHFYPLCLGGANTPANLWPQHMKTGRLTDPLEPLLCTKLQENKISQAEAIRLIRDAKLDPNRAAAIYAYVFALENPQPLPPPRPRPPLYPRPELPFEPLRGAGPRDLNECL